MWTLLVNGRNLKKKEIIIEGLAVIGFVFGMIGVVALVRLEKLTKTLKEKGILEDNLQGRVNDCCKTLRHGRMILTLESC